MIAELSDKSKMYHAVQDFLHRPQNETLWANDPPLLAELVEDFEARLDEIDELGADQTQAVTGATTEQNLAEVALEDAAYRLSCALELYLRRSQQLEEAAS